VSLRSRVVAGILLVVVVLLGADAVVEVARRLARGRTARHDLFADTNGA